MFVGGSMGFLDMGATVSRVLDEHVGVPASEVDLPAVLTAERWARARAGQLLDQG